MGDEPGNTDEDPEALRRKLHLKAKAEPAFGISWLCDNIGGQHVPAHAPMEPDLEPAALWLAAEARRSGRVPQRPRAALRGLHRGGGWR